MSTCSGLVTVWSGSPQSTGIDAKKNPSRIELRATACHPDPRECLADMFRRAHRCGLVVMALFISARG
jgi:hypothetical protein